MPLRRPSVTPARVTPTRVAAVVGRLFVIAGVLVLLFVAYQLWGTGWQEARAQDRLEREFAEKLAAATVPPSTAPGSPPTSTSAPAATTTLPSEDEATDRTRTAPTEIEHGDAMARIEIPRIGVDKLVVQGTSVPDLRKGPGHYVDTPLPGEPGNTAIAGHRTTYGAPFGDIDELEPDDEIIVTTLGGRFTYRVIGADRTVPGSDPSSGHVIVEPTDVWVLDDFGDHRLTLTACHPKYSARERIIVAAELVDDPVEVPPTTTQAPAEGGGDPTDSGGSTNSDREVAAAADLDEGLGGDPSARTAAISWGLLFFAMLAGVWVASTRWKRWPSYAIGVLPLMVVLYVWFENLDRWLPAR